VARIRTEKIAALSSCDSVDTRQQVSPRRRNRSKREIDFQKYADDPIGFCKDVLGVTLWKKQEEMALAVRDHYQVAVRSGHAIGKTLASACIGLWWFYARQGRVISTAPTKNHVEGVLWAEIHRLRKKAKVALPGEVARTAIRMDDEWYFQGFTTDQEGAFQGRHHPRLLVIIDEAAGVPESIHLEASTCASDVRSNRIFMVGNPTSLSGTFYQAFQSDQWHQIHVSCFDHPNVTEGTCVIPGSVSVDWIGKCRSKWGEQHPYWYSRVLGEFPRRSMYGIIPRIYIDQAQCEQSWKDAKLKAEVERVPRVAGLDVARSGESRNAFVVRRGDVVEAVISWPGQSIMKTAEEVMNLLKQYSVSILVVDCAGGWGAGVADSLLQNTNYHVIQYNGGHRAFTPSTFSNRRSELWWHVRHRLEQKKLWFPPASLENHGELKALFEQLQSVEYHMTAGGKLSVEPKEEMLARGFPSPDQADALVMSFAVEEDPSIITEATPNRSQDSNIFQSANLDYYTGTFSQFPVE